jgi:hypothetical protein
MGWLITALAALLILGVAGIAAPGIFGPVFGGLAPLIFVIALIGLGAVWWRHAGRRIDPQPEPDERDGTPDASRDATLRGEDEAVET